MKLKDLISAFAAEIELAHAQMEHNLDELAVLDNAEPAFMDALEQYSGQTQRMGEAAELAGFPGLKLVCAHMVENSLMLAAQPPGERAQLIDFLRNWPPLIVNYLHHLDDPSCAAGLIDYLEHAPITMGAEQGLKVIHMLGAIPVQVDYAEGKDKPHRPVLASPDDVALVMAEDVDHNFLEGFFQEAPEQVHHLVMLARNMVSGEADSSDIIAAKRVAHTLKGSGATIGLRGLAALGHHLEDILEYFEERGGHVTPQAANALLDAAYCLEQMVGFVMGSDDYPEQAQAVLQTVLDLANRIDAGESLEQPSARAAASMPGATADTSTSAAPQKAQRPEPVAAQTSNTLRVSKQNIEELFLVSSEMSVGSAAMETRIKNLVDSSRELLSQNLRVQKRMFELETILQMRTLTRKRANA
ncbi:MAG TPA: hypothetical protein DIC36_04685, partial [Gammaproteobacteria bacterium]|nr:hypothetical protein [Gammaproteobacteria bacterium]